MKPQTCEGETEGCSKKTCFWQEEIAEIAEGWKCSAQGNTILLKKTGFDSAVPGDPGDTGRTNALPDGTYYCQKSELCTNLGGCAPVFTMCCETFTIPFTEPPYSMTLCYPCPIRYCSSQITVVNGGDLRSINKLDDEAEICTIEEPHPPVTTQTAP